MPLVAQTVENLPAKRETRIRSLGQEDPLVWNCSIPLTTEPDPRGNSKAKPPSKRWTAGSKDRSSSLGLSLASSFLEQRGPGCGTVTPVAFIVLLSVYAYGRGRFHYFSGPRVPLNIFLSFSPVCLCLLCVTYYVTITHIPLSFPLRNS